MAYGRTDGAGKGRCEARTGSAWIHELWREVDDCHLAILRSGQGLYNCNLAGDPGWMGLEDGPPFWRSEGQHTASGVREREESEMRWGCVVILRWRVGVATQIRQPVKKPRINCRYLAKNRQFPGETHEAKLKLRQAIFDYLKECNSCEGSCQAPEHRRWDPPSCQGLKAGARGLGSLHKMAGHKGTARRNCCGWG